MTSASSLDPTRPPAELAGHAQVLASLLRVARAAISDAAQLQVLNHDEILAMKQSGSAEQSQLGRLCEQVLVSSDALLLPALPRTADRPRTGAETSLRTFAGFPLLGPFGHAFAVLVAIADQRRPLTERDLSVLTDTADVAAEQLSAEHRITEAVTERDKFQAMVDASQSIITARDLDGRLIYVSAAVERFLGRSPAELVAQAAGSTLNPLNQSSYADAVAGALAGQNTRARIQAEAIDGSWHDFDVALSPARDSEGAIIGCHSSSREITAELESARQLEIARREAAARLVFTETLLETLDVGVIACAPDGQTTISNRVATELLTKCLKSDENAINPSEWLQIAREDGTVIGDDEWPIARSLRDGLVIRETLRVDLADGQVLYLQCLSRRMHDEEGNVLGAVVSINDLSDLIKSSADLSRARDDAAQVINAAVDAFICQDEDGVILGWNPAAERQFGWSAAEAIGRTSKDLIFPAGDLPDERDFEVTTQHRDGRRFMTDITAWTTEINGQQQYNCFLRDVTEQHAAAAAVEQAHAELTQALDAMPRSITLVRIIRDASGQPFELEVHWANRNVRQFLGKSPEQLHGRPFEEAFPNGFRRGLREDFLQVARTGKPLLSSLDWVVDDELQATLEIAVVPWTADGLLIESTDVTAQTAAQRALERSERILVAAQRAARMGSAEADLHKGTWNWSSATLEMFGLDPAGEPPTVDQFRTKIVHPDDRVNYAVQWDEMLAGDRESVQFRILRPDLSVRHILIWADIERSAEGLVENIVLSVQDQTNRMEHEIALARSRELERLVIDLSPIGIALMDESGRFVQVNNAFCAMLGRSREEMLTQTFIDVTHPDEVESNLLRHHQLCAGTIPGYATDNRYLHANGRPLWVSVHKTPLRTEDTAQPMRILAQIVDISERQQRADELSREARTDPLTGLANRRRWEPRLLKALSESHANSEPLAVAILDLDKFKDFNDTYGHPVGDQLLVETSGTWRAYLIRNAPRALLARLGGEEFGVLMPNTDAVGANLILQAMITSLPRQRTASAGFSLANQDDDPHTIMTRADAALYSAKEAGRARVCQAPNSDG